MNVQVLTNVRADNYFLDLWLHYYGSIFGRENLHVMLDGDDWEPVADLSGVNVHVVPHVPRDRPSRLHVTARWQSRFAGDLLKRGARAVLRCDIDEFIAVDPAARTSLAEFANHLEPDAMKAALGLDLIQGPDETSLVATAPILEQRRHAVITRQYCKLVFVTKPLQWVGGFHRGRHVPIDIAPNLLLFHLALFDRDTAIQRIAGRKGVAEHPSQGSHIGARLALFDEVAGQPPMDFDAVRETARSHLIVPANSKTGPHPGTIPDGNVARGYHVRLPDRFRFILPIAGQRQPT